MINTLIERDLWSMDRRKEAMGKINPILNELTNAVMLNPEDTPEGSITWDNIARKYIEVDVWDWCALIVLNVLPSENKELFNSFKQIFSQYGVKEYKKENDAESEKRKLRANFLLFGYESYKDDYIRDYRVDIIFRGNLPETCRLEYQEHYEEVDQDLFIINSGKVMKKETTVEVICNEKSMLKLPEANA